MSTCHPRNVELIISYTSASTSVPPTVGDRGNVVRTDFREARRLGSGELKNSGMQKMNASAIKTNCGLPRQVARKHDDHHHFGVPLRLLRGLARHAAGQLQCARTRWVPVPSAPKPAAEPLTFKIF